MPNVLLMNSNRSSRVLGLRFVVSGDVECTKSCGKMA